MGLPLDRAQMVAFFLETFVYGLFFTLFWILIIVLCHRGNSGRVQRRILIPVSVTMLLLATIHLITNFLRLMQAFGVIGTFSGTPTEYYENLANPLHLTKLTTYITQTIIGDSVIIWRCFVVYNRNWYIVTPNILAVLANACIGYSAIWRISKSTGSDIFDISSASFIITFFVLTMITSLISTCLIAWRLCFSCRCGLQTSRSLVVVLIAIVESGALYASSVLALLITFLLSSNGQYPVLDLMTPLVGVVFLLIVLQIQFHVGSDTTPIVSGEVGSISNQWSRTTALQNMGGGSNDRLGFPMQPVTVRITQESGATTYDLISEERFVLGAPKRVSFLNHSNPAPDDVRLDITPS